MSIDLQARMGKVKGLTHKQKTFIEHYLIHLNAKEAARQAGYSERSCEQQGSKLMANPAIRAIVDEELRYRREANRATAEKVIDELSDLAFHDPDIGKRDKLKALELLGKHFAIFTERIEQANEQQIKIMLPPELAEKMHPSKK